MSRAVLLAVALVCAGAAGAAARPVRRTLNFNMFLLQPKGGHKQTPDRLLLTTDGVSRFGPLLEYLVQRVQGMMSVRLPPEQHDFDDGSLNHDSSIPMADNAENEVDAVQDNKAPGIVVRPSQTKPGTYEVEIDVVVDDGQPENKSKKRTNSF